jgi:hypothetical protein
MNKLELDQLIKAGDFNKVKQALENEKPEDNGLADAKKQYDVNEHEVMKREDKMITTNSGKKLVKLNKIGLDFQVLISFRHAAILCANKIQLLATPKDEAETNYLQVIQKSWDDNKLDYKTMQLAEMMLSETECAELWYLEDIKEDKTYWANTPNEGRPWRMRSAILASSRGDELLPSYDDKDNLIAFGRGFKIKVQGKDEEHFDLYTDKTIYKCVVGVGGKLEAKQENNLIQKIPIIYFKQAKTAWANVQTLISRLELLLSKWGDINDYNGSPILVGQGKIKGLAEKGEDGKVFEIEKGGKLEYLSWDHAPESIKNEIETLIRLIYVLSNTPDVSFENMKGLGATSGFALEMMFMDAHMKAAKTEGTFGEGIQRRINFLKHSMAHINVKFGKNTALSIKPKFEYFMPKNISEMIDILTTAVQGGIMSKETAVSQNPLVKEPAKELERIKAEQPTDAEKLNNDLND